MPPRMITVPAGRVTLTDRRTSSRWHVELDAYRIAATPVTRAEYGHEAGGEQPAADVSWFDAVAYCVALSRREGLRPAYRIDGDRVEWDRAAPGYRLPTEAEWEYAARAGGAGPRYGELDAVAWHRGNSGERSHPVGTREPNAWGLHDTLGNVWEWCWDVYDPEVYGEYRVLRGGGWFDEPWSVRFSVRRRSHPSLRLDDVGFRLARST